MNIKAIVFGTAALAVAGSAMAADKETVLSSMEGQVMVNQGSAYVEAAESMLLYPGDRLMVMQGGSAQVQFANGCVQTLGANEIATVGTADSCSTLQAAGTHNQVGSSGSSGGGSGSSGRTPADWVGIAGIAGMGGYIVYKATDDNDNDREPPPASP